MSTPTPPLARYYVVLRRRERRFTRAGWESRVGTAGGSDLQRRSHQWRAIRGAFCGLFCGRVFARFIATLMASLENFIRDLRERRHTQQVLEITGHHGRSTTWRSSSGDHSWISLEQTGNRWPHWQRACSCAPPMFCHDFCPKYWYEFRKWYRNWERSCEFTFLESGKYCFVYTWYINAAHIYTYEILINYNNFCRQLICKIPTTSVIRICVTFTN